MRINLQIASSLPGFAVTFGWQEFILLYMFGAAIAGSIKLFRKDPASWRKGGFILLSIPVLFLLLWGIASL